MDKGDVDGGGFGGRVVAFELGGDAQFVESGGGGFAVVGATVPCEGDLSFGLKVGAVGAINGFIVLQDGKFADFGAAV